MSEQKVTMKNTKAEMLEALDNALKRAEAAEKGKLNPEKAEREIVEKKAIETAKKAVEQNIFSKELNDKFNDLQVAIAAEESRLQELYGVGRELQKLALIIESGNDSIERIEAEKLARTEEAKNDLKKLELEYNQKSAILQAEHDEAMKKLKVERTRENEEFQYNLKRTRDKDNNAWIDEKLQREAALKKIEEQAAELLAEAENKAEYVRTLEAKVDGIGDLVETEKRLAVDAAIEALNKEFEHKAALADIDNKNLVARLDDKVTYLEKELDVANKTISALQNKLDKAYVEMRELATKTVESASGVKIIGNTESKG